MAFEQLIFDGMGPEEKAAEEAPKKKAPWLGENGTIIFSEIVKKVKEDHPDWSEEDVTQFSNAVRGMIEDDQKKKRSPEDFDPMMK